MDFKWVIKAAVAENEEALRIALGKESSVIIIKGLFYYDILPKLKEVKQAKSTKKIGGVAATVGFLAGGPLGWAALAVGGAGMILGGKGDPEMLKKYKIEIREEEEKIYLYKAKGENKFNPRKYTFSEE